LQRQHGRKIGGAALLLLALGVSLCASFTGYLDPMSGDEETKHRFVILHFYDLPITLAMLLAAWMYLFRHKLPS
jgi:hypothetical protein